MTAKKADLGIRIETNKDETDKFSLPQEILDKVPRPGESIFIIEQYPVITEDMVGDNFDGVEILEEDIKVKPPMGYSYNPLMVKASILNDDLDECTVNGDYKIPLYKNSGESSKKILTFTNEDEALDKYRTLMNVSIKEADRREKVNAKVKEYLKEAVEKLHH